MAATALTVLAGCSSESEIAESAQLQAPQAVAFGAYQAQSTKTRAEISGVGDLAPTGFGVFAYYTDTENYGAGFTPNFMYNQQVTGALSGENYVWTYSPLKYWPNDIAAESDIDGNGATGSVAGGKVSFFAYAPYSSSYTFSGASDTGNPTVTFTVDGNTDLLWGTAGSNTVNFVNADEGSQGGTALTGGLAPVWVDITRPKANDKITFNFRHAQAKFGGNGTSGAGIKIKLNPDETDDNSKTKVTVRSIQIAYENSSDATATFASSGTLDLATGLWSGISGTQTFSFNLTRDAGGEEETQLNPAIAETTDVNENLLGEGDHCYGSADEFFNNDTYNDSNHPGVTATPTDVFASGVAPFFFIPGTTPTLKVTVSYVVRTYDEKLATKYTEVEQTVSKTVTFNQTELNKSYGLLISLGLTSVKFDVTSTVDAWDEVDGSSNPISTQVDLPANN